MAKKLSATLGNGREHVERLTFEPVEGGKVWVRTRTANYGYYLTSRFGSELNRDWVRTFAEMSGLIVEGW